MRFMALSNFYYNGLVEADPAKPAIFEFPDTEIPSIKWWPLDAKAKAALEKRADEIALKQCPPGGDPTKFRPRVHGVPGALENVSERVEVLLPEPKVKVDPDALPKGVIEALVRGRAIAPEPVALVEAVKGKGNKRASDVEPK